TENSDNPNNSQEVGIEEVEDETDNLNAREKCSGQSEWKLLLQEFVDYGLIIAVASFFFFFEKALDFDVNIWCSLFSELSVVEIKKASAAPRECVSTVVCYLK
ncbi:hypothetical protein DPMN_110324, partial [Dreissena polymorpha]